VLGQANRSRNGRRFGALCDGPLGQAVDGDIQRPLQWSLRSGCKWLPFLARCKPIPAGPSRREGDLKPAGEAPTTRWEGACGNNSLRAVPRTLMPADPSVLSETQGRQAPVNVAVSGALRSSDSGSSRAVNAPPGKTVNAGRKEGTQARTLDTVSEGPSCPNSAAGDPVLKPVPQRLIGSSSNRTYLAPLCSVKMWTGISAPSRSMLLSWIGFFGRAFGDDKARSLTPP
jgi:hypothetical protein